MKLQIFELYRKSFYHKDAKITFTGNWTAITNKTKIVFTVDENEVSIQNEAKDAEILKEKKLQRINERDDGIDSISFDKFTSSIDDCDSDSKKKKKKKKKKLIKQFMMITIVGYVSSVALIVQIILLSWYFASYKKRNNANSSTVQSNNKLNQLKKLNN